MSAPDARIDRWLDEWSQSWSLPQLAAHVQISFSRRIRSSLGRCHPTNGDIRLNPALLDEDEALLREVVCHEAAHAAVHLRHGRGPRPHGPEWKELMRAAGYEPRVRMPPSQLSERFRRATAPRRGYLHRCPACDLERVARRRMPRWRCGACRKSGREGKLEISRQPG